ncbi:MAG TPA: polyprenyl synthetase family protein [Candidatus Micrarchaeia archaeon]|nr:polyprenyl synthetase family protein [Candidatus Micrarchaeia archaeon]
MPALPIAPVPGPRTPPGEEAPELPARAAAVLQRHHGLIVAGLRDAAGHLPDAVREPVLYHCGLLPGARLGKAVRPALTCLVGEGLGERPDRLVPLAVAIQLVHDFSLVHDDIVDEDRERRGKPALWVRDGVATALNAGDALLTLAFRTVAAAGLAPATAAEAVAVLSEATLAMVAGQQTDIAATGAPLGGLTPYLTMVGQKTGALMGAACALGAVGAGAPPGMVQACGEFGRTLGVAFQLRDDVLGVFGDSQATGKPVGNDLLRRKLGLPLLLAQSGPPRVAEAARRWAEPGGLGAGELAAAIELLESDGVAARCTALTTTWTERALSAAARLPLLDRIRADLDTLGRWLGERWA